MCIYHYWTTTYTAGLLYLIANMFLSYEWLKLCNLKVNRRFPFPCPTLFAADPIVVWDLTSCWSLWELVFGLCLPLSLIFLPLLTLALHALAIVSCAVFLNTPRLHLHTCVCSCVFLLVLLLYSFLSKFSSQGVRILSSFSFLFTWNHQYSVR